jgi:hypothetical protein
MHMFLDESGDLGFGDASSRHFLLCLLATSDYTALKRAIRAAKRRYGIPHNIELKGSASRRRAVCDDVLKALVSHAAEIHYIVALKTNVYDRLRQHENVLYNYLAGVLVPKVLALYSKDCHLIADERITHVPGGLDPFNGYLKTRVWGDFALDVELTIQHTDSRQSLGIQAADVAANALFRRFESREYSGYNIIRKCIGISERWFFTGK